MILSDELTPRDIETVLHRLGIEPNGRTDDKGWTTIKSPLREERNPSFGINLQTGAWRDHGTDESGDLVTLAERVQNYDTKQAINWIKEQTDLAGALYSPPKNGSTSNNTKSKKEPENFWTPERILSLSEAQQRLKENPDHEVIKQAKKYDCLSLDTLQFFGVGLIEKWSKDWLAFPYQTGCQLYRREDGKVIRSLKGSSPGKSFFGSRKIAGDKDSLYIAKSPRECMLLHQQYGHLADVIGLATGEQGKVSTGQIESLRNEISASSYSNIYVFMDCDSKASYITAKSFTKELSNALEREIYIVNIDSYSGDSFKDVTDCIRAGMDQQTFNNMIDHAETVYRNTKGQSIQLSTVQTKPIKWLHPGRIPRGKITVLAGDPDVGKTFLTLDIAARVSTGNRWPDGTSNQAGNVLILSAEDDLADTIVPRLAAAGANLNRIHALTTVTKIDSKAGKVVDMIPTLTEDFQAVEDEINIHQPKLLIVDPINAYLPGIDTHRDAELRSKVFAPLKKLAEDYSVAVVCVMHLNKSSSKSAKHRVSGSIAYVAASRATWLITNDKDEHSRKLMIPVKFNIGPKPDGLAYKIIENQDKQPVLAWEPDPIDIDADEALSPDGSTAPERDAAQEFLIGMLSSGPVPASDIYSEAEAFDIAKRTLKRAKKKIGIKAYRTGSKGEQGGGQWYWKMPDNVKGATH